MLVGTNNIRVKKVGAITFHIGDSRVAVSTNLQFMEIVPATHYCYNTYNEVVQRIKANKVKRISDLFEETNGRVILRNTKPEWFYERESYRRTLK